MGSIMVDLTRKQFLNILAAGLCSSNDLIYSAPFNETSAPKNNNAPEFPSYLKGYEAQYRINPRAAAIEWHRNAKWGLFIHYALHSLRGITAKQALATQKQSGDEWKKLKQGTQAEYAKIKDQFKAEKFDADFITDLALEAKMGYINFTTRHLGELYMFRTKTSDFNS